jgi:hypothetical protein
VGRISKRQDDVVDMAMCRSSGQTGTQGNATSRRRLSAAGKQASNVASVAVRGQKQGSKRADGQKCVLYVCVAYVCSATFFLFFYPKCTNTSVVTNMLLFLYH